MDILEFVFKIRFGGRYVPADVCLTLQEFDALDSYYSKHEDEIANSEHTISASDYHEHRVNSIRVSEHSSSSHTKSKLWSLHV